MIQFRIQILTTVFSDVVYLINLDVSEIMTQICSKKIIGDFRSRRVRRAVFVAHMRER